MLRLTYSQNQFIARCDYADRMKPREAGFTWDVGRRHWFTTDLRRAARLREYADKDALETIAGSLIRFSPWRGPLLVPPNLKLKDFQARKAVPFVLERSRSYLALEAGLGKTIVAAVARNTLAQPAVYISPPFLVRNVENEFNRWSVGSPTILRLDVKDVRVKEADILIVPDSVLSRSSVVEEITDFANDARALGFEPTLYIDEAHRFKNPSAQRTKTLFDHIVKLFSRRVWLSGTPMPSRPFELYPVLSSEAPETIGFMSSVDFGFRYCAGHVADEVCPKCHGGKERVHCRYCKGTGGFSNGYDFSGASNLAELQENVYGKFMLRMRKADVLKELPPKTEEIVIIGDAPAKLIKAESALLRKNSPDDLMEGRIGADNMATYLRLLGDVKVKPAVQFIRELLEETDESFLIYAFHKKVIEGLTLGLQAYKPQVITGQTKNSDRERIVRDFQTSKARGVMIGNYLAMGIGFTLTKANRVVFVEWGWVPDAENAQAVDRAHRIGQTQNVHSQYLVFENSIDAKKLETNFRKRKITGYI